MSENNVLQNILQQVNERAQNTQDLLNRVNSIRNPVPVNEILAQLQNIDTKIQEVTLILANKPVYFKQTTAVQALASKQLTLNNAQIAKDTITSELISKRQLVVAAQSALTIAITARETASQIVTIKTTAVSEAEAQTTIAINAMQVAAEATQKAQTAEVRAQAAEVRAQAAEVRAQAAEVQAQAAAAAVAKIEQDRLARIAAQEAAAQAAAALLIETTQTNITPGNTFIDLSWNTPPNGGINITSYLIKKSVDLSNWVDLSSTTTSFRASNLLNDTIYYFNIRARNNVGLGPESNIIFGIPKIVQTTNPATNPATTGATGAGATGAGATGAGATYGSVPSKITPITVIPGDTFVELLWNAPDSGGINITEYLIKKSTDNVTWTNMTSDRTYFKAKDLLNDTKYYFQVQAKNTKGLGLESSIYEATPTNNNMLYIGIGIGVAFLFLILIFSMGGRDNQDRGNRGRDYGGRDYGGRDYGGRDYGGRDYGGRDYGGRD